jgi:hypothetical protein
MFYYFRIRTVPCPRTMHSASFLLSAPVTIQIVGQTSKILYLFLNNGVHQLFTCMVCWHYYPALDKTFVIALFLHLICFIIRLYSCNINPYLVNLWIFFFAFCIPSHLLTKCKKKNSQVNEIGINVARIQSDYKTY